MRAKFEIVEAVRKEQNRAFIFCRLISPVLFFVFHLPFFVLFLALFLPFFLFLFFLQAMFINLQQVVYIQFRIILQLDLPSRCLKYLEVNALLERKGERLGSISRRSHAKKIKIFVQFFQRNCGCLKAGFIRATINIFLYSLFTPQ